MMRNNDDAFTHVYVVRVLVTKSAPLQRRLARAQGDTMHGTVEFDVCKEYIYLGSIINIKYI